MGKREAAREIGISAATLMRLEEGRLPDLETFAKVCEWLGADPSEFLGTRTTQPERPSVTLHLRAERFSNKQTAEAIARMVMLVAEQQEGAEEEAPDVDT